MIFQTLDDKRECVSVYHDGQLKSELPADLTRTWKYSLFLDNMDIEYAYLYSGGKTLSEMCPERLTNDWGLINKKLKAFYKSFKLAKISLYDNCFFDLVPERFLLEYCELKNEITDYIFRTTARPDNYEHLCSVYKILEEIKYQKININRSELTMLLTEVPMAKKMYNLQPYVKYNLFGTKTGRLSTERDSFPALTLDKRVRKVIYPNNDLFVEFDFNAAEFRTLLALSGIEQPEYDIHTWHMEHVFVGERDKKKAKLRAFEWLYNHKSVNKQMNKVYNKNLILEKFYSLTKGRVHTIYNRNFESDLFHALNGIVQSTSADILFEQKVLLHNFMKQQKMKTFISLTMHDSILLDLSIDDSDKVGLLKNMFEATRFGKFKANVKIGKNFGEMKKCDW